MFVHQRVSAAGVIKTCNPPDLLQESLGPFGPEVSRECASGCPSGCLRGPKGPRDTPKDTPGETPGTLRARKARETPVAGRGGLQVKTLWGTYGRG